MAPHSSTLAWKIPRTEEPGRLQSMGLLESDTTERLDFHFSLSCIGEGNGNPLQCSCLENPRDTAEATLCDPIDSSLPGSSIHGIFQAKVLEWAAIAFSSSSSYLSLISSMTNHI